MTSDLSLMTSDLSLITYDLSLKVRLFLLTFITVFVLSAAYDKKTSADPVVTSAPSVVNYGSVMFGSRRATKVSF